MCCNFVCFRACDRVMDVMHAMRVMRVLLHMTALMLFHRKTDRRCENRNFKPVPKSAACKDYQEIKIQEHVHKLGMGSIPRSMLLILQDDLVDKVAHQSLRTYFF
jgi:DNA replicative helicase MCM subunit Mcm2 (Cdc46/Mcm family)